MSSWLKAGEVPGLNALTRRELLYGAGLAVGASLLPLRELHADDAFKLEPETVGVLEASPYVYISPLHPDGKESQCHGEVWYTFDQGGVVIATGKDRWKTRALERGWSSARIWVGDHGRVKSDGDGFRKAPSFRAQASRESDPAAFERLMTSFGKKYSKQWVKWEPRFREGYGDGSRVLIRYEPVAP